MRGGGRPAFGGVGDSFCLDVLLVSDSGATADSRRGEVVLASKLQINVSVQAHLLQHFDVGLVAGIHSFLDLGRVLVFDLLSLDHGLDLDQRLRGVTSLLAQSCLGPHLFFNSKI